MQLLDGMKTRLILPLGLALSLVACGDSDTSATSELPPPDAVADLAVPEEPAVESADIPPAFADSEPAQNATSEGLHQGGDPGESLYRRGLYREALEYWEVAAEDEDNAYAAYRLGVEYYDAQIVERDIPTSVRYQQMATEFGSAAGMFELAGFYEAGLGVPPDLPRAAQLYLQSALRGFPPAQHNVATMFEEGAGLERDLVRAYLFYHLAIEQGFRVNFEPVGDGSSAVFSDPRRRLDQELSDEEIALVQDLIANFEPIE